MKVLVVGSGGREHALCWRLRRSPSVNEVFCAPGNPGTAGCATNVPLRASALDGLVDLARELSIDLTVVGPEQPLCDGLQDRFAAAGLRLVGPSAAAARLEGSKAFAKQFMRRHGIPTADFGIFDEPESAARLIDADPGARVVKADGLAAGKGVFLCGGAEEAKETVRSLIEGRLGGAGRRVVVEHRLVGEEVSVIALTDGERVLPLASSQDHKALLDGDQGPNTGGMGAYSPAPVLDPALERKVVERVLEPTVAGLAAEGTPYRGVLYAGLMVVGGEPSVLEYNCRMGDPETQPLMARFADDLMPYLLGAAEGRLPATQPNWDGRPALCVVMAASGYPGAYHKGAAIEGLSDVESMRDVMVFHAGTDLVDGRPVTSGGRVLGVTALGETLAAARDRAYRAVETIGWPGAHYRRDIGHRALG